MKDTLTGSCSARCKYCLWGQRAAKGDCSAAIKKWKTHLEIFLNKVIVGKCWLHGVLNTDPRQVELKAFPRSLGTNVPLFGGVRWWSSSSKSMFIIILSLKVGGVLELAKKLLSTLSGGRILSMDRDGYISGLAIWLSVLTGVRRSVEVVLVWNHTALAMACLYIDAGRYMAAEHRVGHSTTT